jgi:hypothetical protein
MRAAAATVRRDGFFSIRHADATVAVSPFWPASADGAAYRRRGPEMAHGARRFPPPKSRRRCRRIGAIPAFSGATAARKIPVRMARPARRVVRDHRVRGRFRCGEAAEVWILFRLARPTAGR